MIKRLLILTVAPVILIVAFYYANGIINQEKNRFTRNFHKDQLTQVKVLDLESYGYYFSGFSGSSFYLGNYKNQDRIIKTDTNFSFKESVLFTLPDRIRWAFVEMSLLQDTLIIWDRSTGLIFGTSIADIDPRKLFYQPQVFTHFFPLSKTLYAVIALNPVTKKYDLARFNLRDTVFSFSNLLKKNEKTLFSYDGMFGRIPGKDVFFYLFYYHSEILLIDNNLKFKNRISTIDHVGSQVPKSAFIQGDKYETILGPQKYVNRRASAYKGFLLVNSAIRADNESAHQFKNNAVIDVYAMENGQYKFSFYIPLMGSKGITDMYISGSTLGVIFKNHFASVFRLNF